MFYLFLGSPTRTYFYWSLGGPETVNVLLYCIQLHFNCYHNVQFRINYLTDLTQVKSKTAMDLENVTTYKYLGTTINNKGTKEDHINKLKGKAEATIQTIFNIAGNNNFSKIEMKTIWKLIDTCLIPTLLYATETWTITKNEIKHIQTIFDNIIKRILKTPTSTPSEIIQLETGFLSIESMIHEKQLMYYHRIHNTNKCQTTDMAINQPKNTMEHPNEKNTNQI